MSEASSYMCVRGVKRGKIWAVFETVSPGEVACTVDR
jgi:hypothetical protein